ncbi:hypothetical protein LZ198_03665 [Myxococcus sp. K15C18031901]|uniref:hypothetical protein n=1 Tax=Myxococcus dinghuensis TaxID=2906761 RepID=UPI0020A6FC1F|nr:hypothetical protein [Myxococcus dinghuensis]MCP3097970.1 hypothetical protein [Myxococcus dinghuensis]
MARSTRHLGTIVYIDGETRQEVSRVKSAQLPKSERFATTREGIVPVVKVIAYTEGDRRIVREFGPEGELLRSTVQLREP